MTDKADDKTDIANEITAEARAVRDAADRAEGTPRPGEGRKWPIGKIGIGIGIGSAALAAAVIYAARSRRKD